MIFIVRMLFVFIVFVMLFTLIVLFASGVEYWKIRGRW
ncbi:hypothetical protein CHITON_1431 [Thermococcus chitonophagus]|uniref:Uncharacterized protein n=1 Tax=Thermococcus chitonophagus TaxID=54262 RepID=A0A160VTG3_9EURY|nr:hypothetical protein CHITON_1431 [Thermococcus chitonophagus]